MDGQKQWESFSPKSCLKTVTPSAPLGHRAEACSPVTLILSLLSISLQVFFEVLLEVNDAF